MGLSPICGESMESNSVTFDDFFNAKLTHWLLMLLFFGVMVAVLMIPGALD